MSHTIHTGDSAETLKQYPDCHFDSIVTDPPYGIEFLGKDWDRNTGAIAIWQECLRVLKPGGFLLAFSAARTYHHLATNIESVGFEIRDQLMWIYASGFPKAQDIGKAIERREGKRNNNALGIKRSINESGPKTSCPKCNKTLNGSNQSKCQDDICPLRDEMKPANNEWSGWKTALKPAHEPIVMARKPFKGSTIDCVLAHGVGALNIDATRVPWDKAVPKGINGKDPRNRLRELPGDQIAERPGETAEWQGHRQGRFPSNVLGEIPDYQKYFYCPKASRRERMEFNNHPTVKPVALMRYLIQLVTPPNSTILDPFCGSGSTGMAACELGHTFVGCELDPHYVTIATKRIAGWLQQHTPQNTVQHTQFEELFETP